MGNTGGQSLTNSTIPTASAVAAAAVTAKIQALDAVATNLGLDSEDIKMEQEKEDNIAKEKEREREREERSREMSQPNNPISRDTSPRRDNSRLDYPPPAPGSPPPDSRTSSPPPAGPGGAGDKVVATQAAMEQAQQLELQKKLMSGSESTTLSQQENMQIKGQSARHLVMQKLMGARGGMRESKVLCLKNMVGSEEVDE